MCIALTVEDIFVIIYRRMRENNLCEAEMKKRKEIEELTIADDFMVGAVMSDPKL